MNDISNGQVDAEFIHDGALIQKHVLVAPNSKLVQQMDDVQ